MDSHRRAGPSWGGKKPPGYLSRARSKRLTVAKIRGYKNRYVTGWFLDFKRLPQNVHTFTALGITRPHIPFERLFPAQPRRLIGRFRMRSAIASQRQILQLRHHLRLLRRHIRELAGVFL